MATASYLDRLLEPLTEAFTPKMASVLLELRADPELEAHIDELRRKAKEARKNNFTATDVAQTLLSAAPRLISALGALAGTGSRRVSTQQARVPAPHRFRLTMRSYSCAVPNDGTLTPVEEAEYKDFVEAVDLISIMQAKARRFLAKQST